MISTKSTKELGLAANLHMARILLRRCKRLAVEGKLLSKVDINDIDEILQLGDKAFAEAEDL